jgi:DNA-binding response OmpR family regulator
MKILVVDDDPHILDSVVVGLQMQWRDREVISARDGQEALQKFFKHHPDLVLLDVNMPRSNGFEVLQAIRRVSDVPIIILTARDDEIDQVRGLEGGADDYITKPFSHLTFIARINSVLRRTEGSGPSEIAAPFIAGDLVIDFQSQRVTRDGEHIRLTPAEYRLVAALARNSGRVMTHHALIDRIWGTDSMSTTNHLKVIVSRLRTKIERPNGPRWIETVRGTGYRLVLPEGGSAQDRATGAPTSHP